ncbi:MAG: hypothetical protein AAF288_07390 [Planctomycetota bacterium]
MSDPYELTQPDHAGPAETDPPTATGARPSANAGALSGSHEPSLADQALGVRRPPVAPVDTTPTARDVSRWCPRCGYDLRGADIDRSTGVALTACVDCGWQGPVRETDAHADGRVRHKYRAIARSLSWVWVVGPVLLILLFLAGGWGMPSWVVGLVGVAGMGAYVATIVFGFAARWRFEHKPSWLSVAVLAMLVPAILLSWILIVSMPVAIMAAFVLAFEMLSIATSLEPEGQGG